MICREENMQRYLGFEALNMKLANLANALHGPGLYYLHRVRALANDMI